MEKVLLDKQAAVLIAAHTKLGVKENLHPHNLHSETPRE